MALRKGWKMLDGSSGKNKIDNYNLKKIKNYETRIKCN